MLRDFAKDGGGHGQNALNSAEGAQAPQPDKAHQSLQIDSKLCAISSEEEKLVSD